MGCCVKFIAHRGNITGPDKSKENTPEQIELALDLGYDVEIDIWLFVSDEHDYRIFSGHNHPQYELNYEFLFYNKDKLWLHAKTVKTLQYLVFDGFNCFYQEDEKFVLTINGWIWKHSNFKELVDGNSVSVCLDKYNNEIIVGGAVCSDYIESWKENYANR